MEAVGYTGTGGGAEQSARLLQDALNDCTCSQLQCVFMWHRQHCRVIIIPPLPPPAHTHTHAQDNPFTLPGRICLRLSSCWSVSLFIAGFHLGRCRVVFVFFFLSESQDGWTCLWGDEVKRKVWLIYRFTLQLLGFYFCILTDLNNNNNNNNESHVYSKPFHDEFFFIMFFILEYFFSNISHLNRFDMGKEAQANLKALLH